MSKLANCLTCHQKLVGKQTKYCSSACKNKYQNNKYQNYVTQCQRGRDRKIQLVLQKGGKCVQCGYSRNLAVLCFHHPDPATKSMKLDLRSLSNHCMKLILAEVEKCILLCANCYTELHNPDTVILP